MTKKKSYTTPKLSVVGNVEKLTQGRQFLSSGDWDLGLLGFILGPREQTGS